MGKALQHALTFTSATIAGPTAQVTAFTRGIYFRAQPQLGSRGGGTRLIADQVLK